MKQETRNMFMAVLMSMLFISSFSLYQNYQKSKNPEYKQPTKIESVSQQQAQESVKQIEKPINTTKFDKNSEELNNDIIIETTNLKAVFTNKGGSVLSLYTKEHQETKVDSDGNKINVPINMIYSPSGKTAFDIKLGSNSSYAINTIFETNIISDKEIEFFTYFKDNSNNKIKLSKTYKFVDDEYLFELKVRFTNEKNEIINVGNGETAYTLSFVPQMGPEFQKLKKRDTYIFRNFVYHTQDEYEKNLKNSYNEIQNLNYAGIDSRYFIGIAIPPQTYIENTIFSKGSSTTGYVENNINFERKMFSTTDRVDTYKFYFGPKTKKELSKYSLARNNGFGYQNENLITPAPGAGFLYLKTLIMKLMKFLHFIGITNWGWVIVLMTIIIKLILFPLTFSSYKSTSAMQEFQPQIKEIQAKFKDNPQKLNLETQKLYRENNINPLKGCLPMLLQMPILFALFGVLRTMFELRGMPFFGWITDLSAPETVFTWTQNIPLISAFSQNNIRILPAIFVLTQILSTKLTQQPGTTSNSQVKMMTYMMPAMFFFMLYNMPSGLFVYWIISNIITTVQQVSIKKVMHYRKVNGKIKPKKAKQPKKDGKIATFLKKVQEEAEKAQNQPVKSKKK